MTTYAYDPDKVLLSTTRSIETYVRDTLRADADLDEDLDVEMSFPDTTVWTKKSPLEHALVHFELDDDRDIVLGMGIPMSVEEHDDGTATVAEPVLRHLNFDVGIWLSPQAGGTTKRLQVREALKGIFGTATGRLALTEATDGIKVVSYGGGTDILDRVNDLPVYRTTQITLVVSVFGRHDSQVVDLIESIEQSERLLIADEAGMLEHVTTDEDPWT